jgi:2-dehydro-3-deoxyphosphogluconate aldolase/(4S)-4-hydroxy-2-oxoglutarate aldolase
MSHAQLVQALLDRGLFAVLRAPAANGLVELAQTLVESGMNFIEIALTTPDGLAVIRRLRDAHGPSVVIGAGTVLDVPTARAAIDAGADFLVSPAFDPSVIELGRLQGKITIPGAFTATEILAAWNAGADFVKVFPVDAVGPAYLQAIRRPLPDIRLLATGAIALDQAAAFLQAGACGLGVGGPLCDPTALATGNFEPVAALARRYVEVVRAHRSRSCL